MENAALDKQPLMVFEVPKSHFWEKLPETVNFKNKIDLHRWGFLTDILLVHSAKNQVRMMLLEITIQFMRASHFFLRTDVRIETSQISDTLHAEPKGVA
jgi:hypothetical protein